MILNLVTISDNFYSSRVLNIHRIGLLLQGATAAAYEGVGKRDRLDLIATTIAVSAALLQEPVHFRLGGRTQKLSLIRPYH